MIDMSAVANACWTLIDEGKYAEVTVALFHHHKKSIKFWFSLKSEIFRSAKTNRDILVAASLLEASTKDTLAESCHLVPGLTALLYKKADD